MLFLIISLIIKILQLDENIIVQIKYLNNFKLNLHKSNNWNKWHNFNIHRTPNPPYNKSNAQQFFVRSHQGLKSTYEGRPNFRRLLLNYDITEALRGWREIFNKNLSSRHQTDGGHKRKCVSAFVCSLFQNASIKGGRGERARGSVPRDEQLFSDKSFVINLSACPVCFLPNPRFLPSTVAISPGVKFDDKPTVSKYFSADQTKSNERMHTVSNLRENPNPYTLHSCRPFYFAAPSWGKQCWKVFQRLRNPLRNLWPREDARLYIGVTGRGCDENGGNVDRKQRSIVKDLLTYLMFWWQVQWIARVSKYW